MEEGDERRVCVLIVDDDEDMRRILSRRLTQSGFDVIEARDGEEAIEATRGRRVDVVLLDVMLPGLDGFSVLARLNDRLNEWEAKPLVVLVSGMGGVAERLRGLRGGAMDFVVKPFVMEELVARVTAAARVKERIDEMSAEARIDPLTGLRNRRSFELSVRAEIARAHRYGRPLSLILVDADDLKGVNDAHGHPTGDDFLRAIAQVLRETVRETDRPARVGGDEFAVILPETDRQKAEVFVGRLRARMAEARFDAGGASRPPSVSIGVAVYPEDAPDEGGLMRACDRALYADKDGGRAAPAAART